MIIFNDNDKVNFVDDNNVFVGYSMSRNCCETFGWFISKQKCVEKQENTDNTTLKVNFKYKKYTFNKKSFVRVGKDNNNMVIFQLKCKGKPSLYLHLYNYHNGYYAHGFEMQINNVVFHRDSI
jgi:hypothetical protein